MTCARYRALISRYLDDELTPRQRAELVAHIEQCASCAADLARYRQDELLLRQLPEGQPKPELKTAVLRETRRAGRQRQRRLLWLLSAGGRVSPRLVVPLLAILLLLPVAISLALSSAARRAIGAPFGFSAPHPSPTVPYLDVPASATPAPPGPLSPPHLVTTNPYDGATGVDAHTALLVGFDQPMDRHSVERAFRLAPPAPGDFQWEADNQLRFRPKAPGLLRGVTYTVALTDGARSLAGGALSPTTVWSFHTLPGPILQAVAPSAAAVDVPATSTLVLTFSRPIDVAAGISLRVDPAAGGAPGWTLQGRQTWSADGRVLRLVPEAPWPAQAMRVTLNAGARDKGGDAVPPSSWTFTAAPPNAEVTLAGPRLRILAPGETGPAIGYSAPADPGNGPAGAVYFALYPLATTALIAQVHWLLDPAPTASGAPWPPVPTAGQAAIRTWTGSIRRAGAQSGAASGLTTTVPIREPGLYLLSAGVTEGRGDQRLLVVSDEGLLLWNSAGRWWAWVSRLGSGQAVAGAQVRLYDAAGGLLTTGTTDNQGLFGATLPPGAMPALALAEHSGNVAVALVDATGLPWSNAVADKRLGASVILDRPRYGPGDTLLFSALVRPPTLALAGAAVDVHLHDPAGREIAALSLAPDAHSAINGAFPLAAGLAPGPYSLVFDVGGYGYEQTVPVESAVAPESAAALEISLQTPGAPVYAGETISATVRAIYGPARPAAGLVLALDLAPADGASTADSVLTATLDDAGLARVPLRVPAWDPEGAPGPVRTYRLVARAADPQGRQATALALLEVRAGHLALEQSLLQHTFVPGASTLLTITVHDEAGQPIAGQVVSSALYTPSPIAGAAGEQGGSLLSRVIRITDATGVATATLALPLQGAFTIRSVVTDSGGLTVSAATRIWVYQADSVVSWAIPLVPTAGLSLTADQESYRPGETAHLFLQVGAAGGGLLVAALGGRVVNVQAIHFSGGGGVFAVPIPADAGTQPALAVRFLRFGSGDGDPRLLAQDIALPLQPAADLELTLPATPGPGGYLPGQPLALHLALHAAGAAPVGGEALVQLAPFAPENAGADFAGLPAAASWPAPAAAPRAPRGPGGPTAYWGADLALDSSGELSTTLGLPDRPGIWALDAWAFLASGVSHTRQIVRTAAPIAVGWSVPGALVQGDNLSLVATITNNQPTVVGLDIHAQVVGDGVLDLAGPTTQGARLAPGESRSLSWTLRALGGGSGQVVLDITGGPPGFPIHRQQAILVTPYGVAAVQSHAGQVADSETINMTLPPDVDPGSAALEVRCASTLAGVLADTLAAQTGAASPERGPVDAAAARLVAAAAVQALYERQGLDPADLPAGLADSEQIDLQDLYSAQQPSGAWGAWPGAQPDLATSVHALQALWELTHDAGVQVDAETVRRGLAWVRQAAAVARAPGADGDLAFSPADAVRVAEAIYVRSLFNEPLPGDLDRLLAGEPDLGPRERAFLALALARSGRGDEAHLVVERLAADAGSGVPDPIVLDALLTADPTGFHDAAVPLASALLAARTGAGWRTPAGTAAAVLALSHYAVLLPEPLSAGSYRIIVNSQVIRDVVVGPSKTGSGRVVLTVPSNRLLTGDNPVRLETSGLHLYYSLRVQALLNTGDHPIPSRHADGAPLGLLRVHEAGPGANTTVVLTLTVTAPLGPSRLADPLPAGLARLPFLTFERLEGASEAAVRQDLRAGIRALPTAGGGLLLALEPLAPGTYVLTYVAAPVAAGSYTALPALFDLPGDPAVWVQSGSDSLVLAR